MRIDRGLAVPLLGLLLGLLLGGCVVQAQEDAPYPPESRCDRRASDGVCSLYGVSLVELIANPQIYDGLRVRVIGWLNLEFEGNAIYLHQDDHVHSISNNGFWVGLRTDMPRTPACNGGYALIEGRFDAKDTGHMGMWSGAIVDVDRCDAWRAWPNPMPEFAPPPDP